MPDEPREEHEAPNELKKDLRRFCTAVKAAYAIAAEIALKGPSPEFSGIAMVLRYLHWKTRQPNLFDPDALVSGAARIAVKEMDLDPSSVWYHDESKNKQVH